jgi:hypothetical protein
MRRVFTAASSYSELPAMHEEKQRGWHPRNQAGPQTQASHKGVISAKLSRWNRGGGSENRERKKRVQSLGPVDAHSNRILPYLIVRMLGSFARAQIFWPTCIGWGWDCCLHADPKLGRAAQVHVVSASIDSGLQVCEFLLDLSGVAVVGREP